MGMGLGRLAARLDERDAESVCLSLPAAHDHQSDRLVDQEPRRIHGDLARADSTRGASNSASTPRREIWANWINSQFGEGIITWNTPFLFRTKPEGSRLLVCGPANYFKVNAHPLTALIESDWVSMSFTMNWKIMVPNQPVRFDARRTPVPGDPALEQRLRRPRRRQTVSYQKLTDNPELYHAYQEWDQGRRRFHDQKAAGEVKPNDWQKDYFQGRDAIGREAGIVSHDESQAPRRAGRPPPERTARHHRIPAARWSAPTARPERRQRGMIRRRCWGRPCPTGDSRARASRAVPASGSIARPTWRSSASDMRPRRTNPTSNFADRARSRSAQASPMAAPQAVGRPAEPAATAASTTNGGAGSPRT